MYQGSSIVGTMRDGKKIPMLVFVFNEGFVIVESTNAELLGSKKTLHTYREVDFWRGMYKPSAKRLDFATFGAQLTLVDTRVSIWPEDTVSCVRWTKMKVMRFLSQRVLRIERSDGSSLDLILYAMNEQAELLPLRDYCKKAFGSRYVAK